MVGQMKLLCITALVLTMPNRIIASTKYDEQYRNYNIGVIGEIVSNSTWQLEISYHWFPIQYVGVGASVGLWRQIEGDNIPATDDWRIKEKSKNAMNGFLMPSLILRTPAIIKTEDIKFGFITEPGMMLNVPYDKVYIENTNAVGIPVSDTKISCNKGKWLAFNFRVGIYASFDNISVSLGYVFSNMDIYKMRRNMQYENIKFNDYYPQKDNIGGLFFKISF